MAGDVLGSGSGAGATPYQSYQQRYHRRRAAVLRLIALVVVLAGCGGPATDGAEGFATDIPIVESLDGFEPCPLPTRSVTEPVIELPLRERYPCRIVAVPTGTEFRSDLAGSYPDPWFGPAQGRRGVAKDSRGRYYTASSEPAILAWDADGTLRGFVARQGEGPGEFAGTAYAIHVDSEGNIQVADRSRRWLVYSADLEYLREWRAPTFDPRSVHHIGDGRLLVTGPFPGAPDSVFHIVADGEQLVSSHGTPRPGRAEHLQRGSRPSHVHDSGVWIAPARRTGEGYVLEHRTLDGRLERVLQRDVPGLPLTGMRDNPYVPEFITLHVDDEGVLWVGVNLQDTNWQPTDPLGPEMNDFRLEVISPGSGEVLASVVYDSIPLTNQPPLYPVQGTSREAFGIIVDPPGIARIGIYELHLVRNEE